MSELSQTEMIALYLQGRLGEKELEMFNARLVADDKFKHEVEVQRAIVKNIARAGRQELRSQLKQFHRQIFDETTASPFEGPALKAEAEDQTFKSRRGLTGRRRVALLVAAGIVATLMATGLAYYTYLSPERIFDDQFIPYKMRTMRGNTLPGDIISLYREQDYNHYLSQYEARVVKSLQETFLAGNAYLVKEQPVKAIQCFRQVMIENEQRTAGDHQYYDASEYFLALAYLQNNEPGKAEVIFKKIMATPRHAYNNAVGSGLLLKIKMARFKF